MFAAILFIPILLPVIAVIFWDWDTATLLFSLVPGLPFAIWGVFHLSGYQRFDENRAIFDTVLDMFKNYPDDWSWSDLFNEGKSWKVGICYSLHDKAKVLIDKRHGRENEITLVITDPVTGKSVDYALAHGYRNAFRGAIKELHHYRELKTMVNVALFADDNRSSAGRADEVLQEYQQKKGIHTA
jgi:hypothetical protein